MKEWDITTSWPDFTGNDTEVKIQYFVEEPNHNLEDKKTALRLIAREMGIDIAFIDEEGE